MSFLSSDWSGQVRGFDPRPGFFLAFWATFSPISRCIAHFCTSKGAFVCSEAIPVYMSQADFTKRPETK